MKTTKIILRGLIVILGLAAIGLGWLRQQQKKEALNNTANMTLADFGPAPEFSLTERSGKKITLNDLKGRPWLGDFIFTRCGGPCPILSLRMSELQKDFKDKSNLQFVSFTIDPEYDTPQVLQEYAGRYNADPDRWWFLTGDSRKVYEMSVKGFHLAVEKNTDPNQKPGEQVNHSLSFVLVDKTGHIRGYYNGHDLEALKRLRSDLSSLLRE